MLAIGATKLSRMNSSSGATKAKASRRFLRRLAPARSLSAWVKAVKAILRCCTPSPRRRGARRSFQQPLVEAFAEGFTIVGPELRTGLDALVQVRGRQVRRGGLICQRQGRLTRRAIGDVRHAGQRLGLGGVSDELEGQLLFRRALEHSPGIKVVDVAVPGDDEGLVLLANGVVEAAVGRLHQHRAAVVEQLRCL